MENKYRVENVDALIYSDKEWKRYFEFQEKRCALRNEPTPFDSWEELKVLTLKTHKESGDHTYMIWKNDQENRTIIFSNEFNDDLKRRFTYLKNGKDDEPLEANLLEALFQEYIGFDELSNALAFRSKNGMNDYVEERYGARIGAISELSELKVKEANINKIESWLAEAPSKFPKLRIEFYDEIPDNLLEEFAALFTQLLEDMPANSMIEDTLITPTSIKNRQEAFKLKKYCIYNYLIFNAENQIIAKTHVSLKLESPQIMFQHMTGVKEKYRGRGLSKWLKAAMYKKLTADFPDLETIRTEAHPNNYASIELSKQMGYRKVGIGKEYFIDRTNILDYLKG